MSRSFKHTPRCGDKKSGWYKRYYNRILRRNKLNPNYQLPHKNYRKLDRAYMICDYESVHTSFEQYYLRMLSLWHSFGRRSEPRPTREQCRKEYEKFFIRK